MTDAPLTNDPSAPLEQAAENGTSKALLSRRGLERLDLLLLTVEALENREKSLKMTSVGSAGSYDTRS